MEHRRNSTGKRKPKCSEETLSQCEFIYLKLQKNRPETIPGSSFCRFQSCIRVTCDMASVVMSDIRFYLLILILL